MTSPEKNENTNKDWETPAYAGLMFSLQPYKDRLEEKRGYKLNSRPREIDVRIIDKLSDRGDRMEHAIAYIFEKHNLVELKNPYENLNIDVVWKGISYAAQYKSRGVDDTTGEKGVNIVSMRDVTLTFLRISRPDDLFELMEASGYKIEKKFPGVYYISGMADIKMQIIVGRELAGDEFVPLRVQRKNASDDDIKKFMKLVGGLRESDDREMADMIMQISISENQDTYDRLKKEDPDMCRALRDLMKDEIQEEFSNHYQAGANASQEDTVRRMLRKNKPISEILDFTDVSEARIEELAEELGVKVVRDSDVLV